MMNRRRFAQASLATLLAACQQQSTDVIIHGGPIYTGVSAAPQAAAVRISGGRFTVVGTLEAARAAGAGAREIDLRGAAAFPGFVDGHVHLTGVGQQAMVLDLVGTQSIADLQQRLATYAQTNPQGPIIGRGWIETHWPEHRFPTHADIDSVVNDRPVYLTRADGHASIANSAALALAQIDATTRNPDGGAIERGADGAPSGMLIDNAQNLVESRLPPATPEQRRQALQQAATLYAQRGWTGVANMSTSGDEARNFASLAEDEAWPLHADLYLTPEDSGDVFERGPYADGAGRVHVRGVKLYMDGALGSRGAALLAPYSDASGSTGLLVTPPDTIRDFLNRAKTRNVQVATHAIGDRGNRLVLDAYRDVFADDADGLRRARWRIEHSQIINPQDLPRFAQMGVIASMQPSHAIGDLFFAPARLGPNRLRGAYAWKTLLNSGAVIAAGSDAPVEKGDPMIEFYAAAYRHALDGRSGPDWHPEETVSREEALRMLTWGPAFAAFQESERGTIEVGKRADVSVFSVDLMQAEFAQIPTAQAVLTISDGRITHEALS